jgi:hypothetical protein
MKTIKLSIILALLLSIHGSISAESKSQIYIGGGMDYEVTSTGKTTYHIRPEVGYFVSPKTAYGLGLNYFSSATTTGNVNGILVDIFHKHYSIKSGNLSLFWQSTVEFGTEKYTYTTSPSTLNVGYTGVSVVPGLSYDVNEGLTILAKFGGASLSLYTPSNSTAQNLVDLKLNFLNSGLSLGFIVKL